MRISSKLLDKLFENSLDAYLKTDISSLLSGVSERNTCGRLAVHLDRERERQGLSGYYVDPEYNRKQQGEIKTIINDQMVVIPITCDLIVHSRGEKIRQDNLIAIEVKKATRPQHEKDSDRQRLEILTRRSFNGIWSNDGKTHPEHVCGYRLGIYVEINLAERELLLEYFKAGTCTKQSSRKF